MAIENLLAQYLAFSLSLFPSISGHSFDPSHLKSYPGGTKHFYSPWLILLPVSVFLCFRQASDRRVKEQICPENMRITPLVVLALRSPADWLMNISSVLGCCISTQWFSNKRCF